MDVATHELFLFGSSCVATHCSRCCKLPDKVHLQTERVLDRDIIVKPGHISDNCFILNLDNDRHGTVL